ncbi:MAG: DNA repair protein RadA [Bacillota bacterium]|nr:DNA repair protein RadA [Bacillota bacterium]
MAKKPQTVFVCSECGYESPKWMGQCICGAWNTFTEEKISDTTASGLSAGSAKRKASKPEPIGKIKSLDAERLDTGIGELNRVLGGGVVKGSLTLISGEPGIGKSTIILQAAAGIAERYGKVLYVSGEESPEQIKIRADRIGGVSEELYILSETELEAVSEAVSSMNPAFLIIDSVQTIYTSQLTSAAGSVSQVRACTAEIMRTAKEKNIPVFIVAHVTKSGELAGPKIVEHLVDTVLNFVGERNQGFRIMRSFKNRFGNTSEIGAFEMTRDGLKEIGDLSLSLLEESSKGAEGAVTTAVYEGSRPLLLEVQALVTASGLGFARRSGIGIDSGRLNMIIAVLEKRTGINLMSSDIYVNVAGGMKPEGTSIDLAAAVAVFSAAVGKPVRDPGTIIMGELGLTGELRGVPQPERIAGEAVRMGFRKIILPLKNKEKWTGHENIEVIGAGDIMEAVNLALED